MAEGGEGEDEIQFLRTDDEVVLQCVATIQKEHRKFCLAAEGLGNRLCYLEPTSEAKYVPPDLCICTFVLEQSLSVRALQEMLANTGQNSEGHFYIQRGRSRHGTGRQHPCLDEMLSPFLLICSGEKTKRKQCLYNE